MEDNLHNEYFVILD